jgi:hypothetical protein
MKDQTRIRLMTIEARYGKRLGAAPTEAELAADRESRFVEAFRRVRAEILVPAMEEIGAQLTAAGHGHRVDLDAGERAPSIELHLLLRGARRDAGNVIRLFTRPDEGHGCEVIAEVQIHLVVTELTRFREVSAITSEVVEQMIVDAVEQVFACNAR